VAVEAEEHSARFF